MSGILYVVATPLGNLEDITYRAVRVLSEASAIACEDTRHTRKLLEHYGIQRPTLSYHDHNEAERTPELLNRLKSGDNIALVSDAGTPLISDPGYRLVSAAAREGLRVEPVPGPCAFIAALSASGLTTDAFYFGGFLPAKTQQRRKILESLAGLEAVIGFYEAPHRIVESLADVASVFPMREVVVARELTKLHEEWSRGPAPDLAAAWRGRDSIKGEITLLIAKPDTDAPRTADSIRDTFQRHIDAGLSRMDAMKATARDCAVSKRDVWNEVEREP